MLFKIVKFKISRRKMWRNYILKININTESKITQEIIKKTSGKKW